MKSKSNKIYALSNFWDKKAWPSQLLKKNVNFIVADDSMIIDHQVRTHSSQKVGTLPAQNTRACMFRQQLGGWDWKQLTGNAVGF